MGDGMEFRATRHNTILLNQTVVPPEIQEFYVKSVMQSAPDTIPEDWA